MKFNRYEEIEDNIEGNIDASDGIKPTTFFEMDMTGHTPESVHELVKEACDKLNANE